MLGLRHQHTTHQLGPARIVYRFHPFFEQEVRVIRRLRAQEEPAVVVQLEGELRIVVPCWMLDAECCREMVKQERPRIAVEALLRLRELVDQQISTGRVEAECGSMTAKGDRHEASSQGQAASKNSATTET